MAEKQTNILLDKDIYASKEVKINGAEWERATKNAKQEIVSNLKIDGFRKGKVPAHIADKYAPNELVWDKALKSYIKEHAKELREEVTKIDSNIVDAPTYDVTKISDSEVEFLIAYPIVPTGKNLKFENIKTKFKLTKVDDNFVDEEIKKVLEKKALLAPLKETEKTKLGDTVVIDYKGFVDDTPFDGGEAQNYELKLGSKTFIDTFEDQLVDKKIGFKGKIEVRFPEKYPVEKLAGQKAQFDVEIKKASRPEKVQLTEDNFKDLNLQSAQNANEAREIFKLIYQQNQPSIDLTKFIDEVVEEVSKKEEIKINPIFVAHYTDLRKKELTDQLKANNIKLKDYIELLGKTEETFDLAIAEEEIVKIKGSVVINALADKVKETTLVTDEDVDNHILLVSFTTGMSQQVIKDLLTKDNAASIESLKANLKEQKIRSQILKFLDESSFAKYTSSVDKATKDIKNFVAKKEKENAKKTESKQDTNPKKEDSKPSKKSAKTSK
ncbi:trigger factor [Mycoplasma sp. Mirounga ES2805-ORL]|uniref:trigger factor n=1 Tax=Mycoplasma sp. Mirounga ES2805-ORL TaxID=754514 RepID=UPI00197C1019|nr:trigger factor [Mycoplasma sp. Mirounga ES2805-ORL]QSF13453.1 trigger factor [Mycoplasma sp. Mirounga ES2805-ORL]